MATIYTVRFGGGYAPNGGQLALFTANDQAVWVLRDVRLAHLGGAAADMYIAIAAGSVLTPIARSQVSALGVLSFVGRQVLEPGDILYGSSSGQPFAALATGYRLQLPTAVQFSLPGLTEGRG